MFYCDTCAKKKGWPITIRKSEGPCEICGEHALNNDRASSLLPEPIRTIDPDMVLLHNGQLISRPTVTSKTTVTVVETTTTVVTKTHTIEHDR